MVVESHSVMGSGVFTALQAIHHDAYDAYTIHVERRERERERDRGGRGRESERERELREIKQGGKEAVIKERGQMGGIYWTNERSRN